MHTNIIRLAVAAAALTLLCGCARSTEGSATEAESPEATTSAAPTTTVATPSAETDTATGDPHGLPEYGVVETTRRAVAAGEVTCAPDDPPAATAEARGSAPGAPIVTVAVPDGFTVGAPGQGDVALNLSGPDGATATVRISPTTLGAAEAFREYVDDRTADYEISSVSVLPGELCEYSGQELMGMLADQPGQGIDYADRVVHVWTGAGDFLVAGQLEAPNGTAALDAAKPVMLADFGIRMP